MKITGKLIYKPENKEDCIEIRKKEDKCENCIYSYYGGCDCQYMEWFIEEC